MASNDPNRRAARGTARLAAGCLALAMLAAGCARTPPEEALRGSVAALESAIESREPGAVADVLAEDFIGPDGLDRDGARRMARLHFLRNRDVGLVIGPLDIALQDRHATVRFTAAVSGGTGAWLPERGSVYRVETGWRRQGDDWRLTSAHWERDLGTKR